MLHVLRFEFLNSEFFEIPFTHAIFTSLLHVFAVILESRTPKNILLSVFGTFVLYQSVTL